MGRGIPADGRRYESKMPEVSLVHQAMSTLETVQVRILS